MNFDDKILTVTHIGEAFRYTVLSRVKGIDEYQWRYYLPIWGALIAFTGLFVIYFIVLRVTSKKTSKSDDPDAVELTENKAFDDEATKSDAQQTTDDSATKSDEKSDEEKNTENDRAEKSPAPEPTPEPVKALVKPKRRLVSLDTFRGFALCGMIFVNYGGGMYWFFEHVPWDGLTFADLMMPWFLFMAGVSIRFGILSRMKRSSKAGIVLECFIRGCKLWALGAFVMNNNSKWETFRIPGVLQRIGISYFIVSISHLGNFKKRK